MKLGFYRVRKGKDMYFGVEDILNGTILGIEKSVIDEEIKKLIRLERENKNE